MKRTPMKRAKSPQRVEREAEMDDATPALTARSGGACEAMFVCETLPEGAARATHRHHRKSRRFGDSTLGNLLHVCDRCHAYGHANPLFAYRVGFLVRSTQDPSDIAFTGRGQHE